MKKKGREKVEEAMDLICKPEVAASRKYNFFYKPTKITYSMKSHKVCQSVV